MQHQEPNKASNKITKQDLIEFCAWAGIFAVCVFFELHDKVDDKIAMLSLSFI
ncbi:hypothetical protein D051_0018 [Vibrio parahaemolyticus VPCR-2010]|uniref:hypothetical protein n=1 Tax=Vibrio parahaemolyticus TaxID=670 RepID=UPI00038E60BE|nr:hypothetical protein D051_0018 [Vibrio parahaemolyticus VPCR-2010]